MELSEARDQTVNHNTTLQVREPFKGLCRGHLNTAPLLWFSVHTIWEGDPSLCLIRALLINHIHQI